MKKELMVMILFLVAATGGYVSKAMLTDRSTSIVQLIAIGSYYLLWRNWVYPHMKKEIEEAHNEQ